MQTKMIIALAGLLLGAILAGMLFERQGGVPNSVHRAADHQADSGTVVDSPAKGY